MKPIEFPEMNATAAEDQPEYEPLPMYRGDGQIISKWSLTWKERLRLLFGGSVWLHMMDSGRSITPVYLSTDSPFDTEAQDD